MKHSNNRGRRQNHIQDSVDDLSSSTISQDQAKGKGGYYTLPSCRFTIVAQLLLFLDLVSSITLWLCGGNNDYLENSMEHFKIRDSVFDLASIAFLRCSILFFVYPWLERLSLKQIDHPYEKSLASRKSLCHFLAIILSVGSLAYSVTKGVLIYEVLAEKEHKLHSTYYALVISAIAFSLLEALCALSSFAAMRRLKVQRILHTPNDAESKNKKQKVNLGRLMTLAKPELWLLFIASLALLASSGAMIAAPYFFGMVIKSSMEKGMSHLNETVAILALIYLAGSIAALIRSWLFTLAGQRLVARIRKQASILRLCFWNTYFGHSTMGS